MHAPSPKHVVGIAGMPLRVAHRVDVGGIVGAWRSVIPSRRVGVAQGVVAAIGITVEGLGSGRVLHVGIHREEAARKRIVAAAVHVNQAEGRHVFVAGITPIKHRALRHAQGPYSSARSQGPFLFFQSPFVCFT